MSNCYNLDGILTALNKEIAETVALLESWKKVTFATKKDGKPFAVMSKNINGARYDKYPYGSQAGQYNIGVTAWSESCGYVNDTIDLWCQVRYLKNPAQIAKMENYMPVVPGLHQIYKYDLEDIKAAVNDHISQLESKLASLNEQKETAHAAFTAFRAAYADAIEKLKETVGEGTTLYYNVLDTVKQAYPYC